MRSVPNIVVEAARWSGMAAVGVLWIGIGSAAGLTGFAVTGELPLSRMANDDRGEFVFGPSLVVAALLFVAFCLDLRRRYPVGRAFVPVMVTAMAGQLVAGVVPIGSKPTSNTVHVVAGLVFGGSIPIFLGLFAANQRAGPWRRTAMRLFGAQALATVAGVALSRLGIAALAEMVPALAFHLWVVVVTIHASEVEGRSNLSSDAPSPADARVRQGERSPSSPSTTTKPVTLATSSTSATRVLPRGSGPSTSAAASS